MSPRGTFPSKGAFVVFVWFVLFIFNESFLFVSALQGTGHSSILVIDVAE